MNHTISPSAVDIVQNLSDEKARLLVPSIIYIALLMVSGIIGNILVFIYYGFVSKMSTNTFFIVVLATYDLLSCFISMPTEITDIQYYFTFKSSAACKCLRFINYVCSIGSGMTLMAIAVDRYKRIYRPTHAHWSIQKAKLFSIILFGVSVFLAWPAIVFYDTHEIELGEVNGTELVGKDCTTTTQEEYTIYLLVYNAIHFLIFIVCSTSVCIMYSIVGRAIYRHRRSLISHNMSQSSENSGHVTESLTQETDLERGHTSGKSEHSRNNIALHEIPHHNAAVSVEIQLSEVFEEEESTTKVGTSNQWTQSARRKSSIKPKAMKHAGIDNETIKITLVMVAVTGLFVLSFLPYLSMIIWRSIVAEHEETRLSGSRLIAYEIGLRSFLLNSGLNPWIYGIFNSNFRHYFYRKCTSCYK